MMNKFTLFLMSTLYIPTMLASSAPAAAAAGAGAGAGARSALTTTQTIAQAKKEIEDRFKKTVMIADDPIALQYSPDGNFLAVLTSQRDGGIDMFSVHPETGGLEKKRGAYLPNPKFRLPEYRTGQLAFSPDSSLLAAGIHDADVFGINKINRAWPLYPLDNYYAKVQVGDAQAATFSPDQKLIAITNRDGCTFFYTQQDEKSKKEGALPALANPYLAAKYNQQVACTFSDDSKWLLMASVGHKRELALEFLPIQNEGLQAGQQPTIDAAKVKINDFVYDDRARHNVVYPKETEHLLKQVHFVPNSNVVAVIFDNLVVTFRFNQQTGEAELVQKTLLDNDVNPRIAVNGNTIAAGGFAQSERFNLAREERYKVNIWNIDPETAFLEKIETVRLGDAVPRAMALAPEKLGWLAAFGKTVMAPSAYQGAYGRLETELNVHSYRNLNMQRHQAAKAVLSDTSHGSAGLLPDAILEGPLREYMLGRNLAEENKEREDLEKLRQKKESEDATREVVQKTKNQEQNAQADSQKLFDALVRGDEQTAMSLLNPFTLNKVDGEGNTPLMIAASHNRPLVVSKILEFWAHKWYSEKHYEAVYPNITAVNTVGNSALKLALLTSHYPIAYKIADYLCQRNKFDGINGSCEFYDAMGMILKALDKKPNAEDERQLKNLKNLLQTHRERRYLEGRAGK